MQSPRNGRLTGIHGLTRKGYIAMAGMPEPFERRRVSPCGPCRCARATWTRPDERDVAVASLPCVVRPFSIKYENRILTLAAMAHLILSRICVTRNGLVRAQGNPRERVDACQSPCLGHHARRSINADDHGLCVFLMRLGHSALHITTTHSLPKCPIAPQQRITPGDQINERGGREPDAIGTKSCVARGAEVRASTLSKRLELARRPSRHEGEGQSATGSRAEHPGPFASSEMGGGEPMYYCQSPR